MPHDAKAGRKILVRISHPHDPNPVYRESTLPESGFPTHSEARRKLLQDMLADNTIDQEIFDELMQPMTIEEALAEAHRRMWALPANPQRDVLILGPAQVENLKKLYEQAKARGDEGGIALLEPFIRSLET